MLFERTAIPDVVIVTPEPRHDDRGFFARTFCVDEFRDQGLDPTITQCSIAFNARRGTLRGLHFQAQPHAETKVIRCIRGALHFVAADVRPGSATYGQHVSAELTADDRRALYVPAGFASGYQTLVDETEIMYEISVPYTPGHEGGIHHADPVLAIAWPLVVTVISERDAALPSLDGRG